MRASSFLAAVVLAVAVSACSSTPPPAFDQADTQAINQLVQDFIKTYNAKDAAGVAKLFGDAGAVMPPNASTVRGTENVREYYVKRFRQGASDLALDVTEVIGAESLAYASGDYRLNMAPEGGEAHRDRGKFLFILRERRGVWQLERLAFSSDFAPDRAG